MEEKEVRWLTGRGGLAPETHPPPMVLAAGGRGGQAGRLGVGRGEVSIQTPRLWGEGGREQLVRPRREKGREKEPQSAVLQSCLSLGIQSKC